MVIWPTFLVTSSIILGYAVACIDSQSIDLLYNVNDFDLSKTLQKHQDNFKYNTTLARHLALLTAVSYCHKDFIQSWNCSPCALVPPLDDIYVIQDKKNDFQGVIGYSHSLASIVVAYRGSVDVMNWIDNLTFYKKNAYKRFPDISVHQGFYWVYKSVASKVLMQVGQLRKKYRNSSLLVTGHSLGGAVAALSAFELQVLHNVTVEAIYTFGEPRVGNSYFSEKMRESFHKLFRLIHFRDVVPHLPPNWIGFMHSAQEIYYDEFFTKLTICSHFDGEDPACSNACSPFGCTSIVDHLTYLNITMSHLSC